jgi:hypothetical protein
MNNTYLTFATASFGRDTGKIPKILDPDGI